MSAVVHERRGHTLWVTLDRPEKRNAINSDVIEGIVQGYRMAAADQTIRAIVLTGRGKAFCAGGDLQPDGGFTFDYEQPTTAFGDLLRIAAECRVPTIARVNGACIAGGMALVCMTDLAVAADSATFCLPEVKVGLFPFQVLALLHDMVAPRIIREWCLCGESFDAQAARAAGLINYAVPTDQLDSKTDWLLERIAGNSPAALRRGKHALRAFSAMNRGARIDFAESQLPLMAMSEDAREGFEAFREKRKARWRER